MPMVRRVENQPIMLPVAIAGGVFGFVWAFCVFRSAFPMANDKSNDRPPGEMSPEDREALKRRATELNAKLETAKHRHDSPSAAGRGEAMGRGMRMATELIGGVIAGSAIGWFLDKWLGNEKPWLFILFFLLGTAAGMLNLIRQAGKERTPPAPSVKEDDEDAK